MWLLLSKPRVRLLQGLSIGAQKFGFRVLSIMARILSEQSEVVHFAGVRRFGETQLEGEVATPRLTPESGVWKTA